MKFFLRRFEIFFSALILIGMSGVNIAGAATSKATVPSQPTGVYAVGGVESATIFWKAPVSANAPATTSFKIIIFDQGKARSQVASDGTVTSCGAGVTQCKVAIVNPERNRTKFPSALNFFFTVAAVNQIGVGPDSVRTMPVTVTFKPTNVSTPSPKVTPNSVATPKPTSSPAVKPKPTSTSTPPKPAILPPKPSPATSAITVFDGLYSGHADVSIVINAGAATTTTYPTNFTVLNGNGSGSADNWTVTGMVTDIKGVASVTASNGTYGSLTFIVNFAQDPTTHVMSGTGKGERTENLPVIGEVKVNFSYNVSRQP